MYLINFILKKKMKKLGDSAGFRYIEKQFDLDMNEERARKLARILVLNDSVILSIPLFVVLFVFDPNSPLKMILFLLGSFVVFTILIIISYRTIGKTLKKKGW